MSEPTNEPIPPCRELQAARARQGLKQEEAARRLGMARSRLSGIETGVIWDLPASEIAQIERVLGVDPMLWIRAAGEAAA